MITKIKSQFAHAEQSRDKKQKKNSPLSLTTECGKKNNERCLSRSIYLYEH